MKPGIQLSRRAFLRLSLLGGIAASAGVVYRSTEAVGFDRWFSWMARGNLRRLMAPRTRVALIRCSSYDEDLLARLREAWEKAGGPDLRDARVVLKPNLVDHLEGFPTFTHPRLIEAMVRLVREQGARETVIADGPAFRRDPEPILNATGLAEVLEREKVSFVDLNYDDVVAVPLKGGYTRIARLLLPRTVCEADVLISMPKLKTHHWTTFSASIKNLFGVVPGIKYGWPKNTLHIQGISFFLAELADSLPSRAFAVVDGVVGMQGDGPLFGSAVPSGVIVAGKDLLAVDATCARLMGFDPLQIDYISFAGWAGIGAVEESKIDLVGEPLAGLRRVYERPPRGEGQADEARPVSSSERRRRGHALAVSGDIQLLYRAQAL